MKLTQKVTRAAAAATAKYIPQSYHEIIASGEEEKDDGKNSDSEKREKDIAEWISQPIKQPSSNEDEEYED